MSSSIGGFLVGLEDNPFVEQLSNRFKLEPKALLKRCVIAGVLLVIILFLICFITQEKPNTDTLTQEESAIAVQSATSFDEDALASQLGTETTISNTTPAASIAVVYVSGAVLTPGVYTLSTDLRIADAVEVAGGFLPEAAQAVINLALPLNDGMQIHVPRLDEVNLNAPSQGLISGTTETSTSAQEAENGGLININTADAASLQTLNGIGPATAQKIIDYRMAHGNFQSKEDLMNVSGIGEKKYRAIESSITL